MALAQAGMHVVLSGRRQEKLEEVASQCGDAVSIEMLDVSDRDAVAQVAQRITANHGRIDVLVASAGINVKAQLVQRRLDDWDSVIRIDLDGSFYCCKAVLPTMKAQGEGLIINISSWAGKHVSVVTGPAYTAAKHAMNAMVRASTWKRGFMACAPVRYARASGYAYLDNRLVPVSAEDRAQMVQPEDCGELIKFLAQMPNHVCINDLTISPTFNRGYVAQAKGLEKL